MILIRKFMSIYKNKIKLWHCYKGEYPISQRFGEHFYNSNGQCVYELMGMDGHNGVDFALPIGTKLIAVSDGIVSSAIQERYGYGNHIRLRSRQNGVYYEVIYGHCSKFFVKQGERVKKGQIIGESGNSGFSSGPHLHFGLRVLDENENVLDYGNGYKGYINPLSLFDLGLENAPGFKQKENDLDRCEVWAKEHWEWFRKEGFDLSISAYQQVDAQWVATMLSKYHKRYNK
jgi:murein DD-endopeptidase MepM/ murein hydrolase activator NlpD